MERSKSQFRSNDKWFYVLFVPAIIGGTFYFMIRSGNYYPLITAILIVAFKLIYGSVRKSVNVRDFDKENDLPTLKRSLDYWINKGENSKIEAVSKRILEWDYPNSEICRHYIHSIPFNRKYTENDLPYFKVVVDEFYKSNLFGRRMKSLDIYMYGYFHHQLGNLEMAQDYRDEAIELNPYLEKEYPEHLNRFQY